MMLFKKMSMAIVLSASISMAFAYDDNDKKAIQKDIKTMQTAYSKQQYKQVINMMPPTFLKVIAQQQGISETEVRQLMQTGAKMLMNMKPTMKTHFHQAKVQQSKTGRDYVLIPVVVDVSGFSTEGTLLAIKEDNKWYYVQLNPTQTPLIQKAYPDIKKLPTQ